MDCPVLIACDRAYFDFKHGMITHINWVLDKIFVEQLPITLKITLYLQLVSYPEDYGRKFEMGILVRDHTGDKLWDEVHTSKAPQSNNSVEISGAIEVLHDVTFHREGLHQVGILIDGEPKAVIPLVVILAP